MATERDPLLKRDSTPNEIHHVTLRDDLEETEYKPKWYQPASKGLDPMEIPKDQRLAILIGIWIATFVTVSRLFSLCLTGG